MATRDGKEVPQCERCTLHKDDAKPRTIVKGDSEMRRVLCDECADNVGVTYSVKAATGRDKADEPKAEPPKAPVATESTAERRVAGHPPQKRS